MAVANNVKQEFFQKIQAITLEMKKSAHPKIKEAGNDIAKMLLNKDSNFLNLSKEKDITDGAKFAGKRISNLLDIKNPGENTQIEEAKNWEIGLNEVINDITPKATFSLANTRSRSTSGLPGRTRY